MGKCKNMLSLREFDQKVNSQLITTREVQDIINDTVSLRFQDPLLASRYLPVFAKYFLFKQDRKIVKSLFYLCDGFKIYDEIEIQRYVYYTYFIIYYVIPSYPKAIEYGLELEKMGFNYPFMELNTYNYMSIMCLSLKIYDEAATYNRKGIEKAKQYFDSDSDIFKQLLLTYYNNNLLINVYSKNYFQASISCEKLKNFVSSKENEDKEKQFSNFISFSILLYEKTFENIVDTEKYIYLMNDFKADPSNFILTEQIVDVHIPLLQSLKDKNKNDDAIGICQFILNCNKIVGDKSLIQSELFAFYDLENYKDDSATLKKFIDKYRNLVRDYNENRFYMNNIIAIEEFKINSLRNNMLKVSDQYSRDALTNCYMRYTLENDFKDIYSKFDDATLAFLDLDNLKYVNDSLGHDQGDIYIKKFVDYVRKELSMKEHIYRYGGDEFIILSDRKKDDVEDVLSKIQSIAEYRDEPSFSFGVASIKKDSKDLTECIKIADERMYEQKNIRKSLR